MMLAKTLFLFTVIVIGFATPAFAESISLKIKDLPAQVNNAIGFTATGIDVNSLTGDIEIISLIFGITVTEPSGDISITIPRNIFDAKTGDDDDEFFILADGEEVKFEEERTEEFRVLSFSVIEGTEEIEIFGTKLLTESYFERVKEAIEKEEAFTQEKFEEMQRDALQQAIAETKAQEEYELEQKTVERAEAEDSRIAFLMASCGEGTVYEVDVGCTVIEEESIDSGPLINSVFAAMGIGLAVMIILWGIGKKRGHKELSADK
jgi:hypothetical protein